MSCPPLSTAPSETGIPTSLLEGGKLEGEEEGDKEVPGTFVGGLENTVFSQAEKEVNSEHRPSAMAARTHMHTHFLRLRENNEVWGAWLSYEAHTDYI